MAETQNTSTADGLGDIGQQLQYKDQSELLDAIDELTRLGLRDYVSLPQLIVCGDQSSGKSSVLEAISHIRFPTAEAICTTFATELHIRRTPSNDPPVCIIPGKSRKTESAKGELRKFPTAEAYNGPDDIPGLVEAAKNAMKGTSDTSKNHIFDDRLRLQLCKPKWPPVTIVDLPGLIHAKNQDQTEGDIEAVSNLVKEYMDDPRSIILAIVSAENDIVLQAVLTRAEKADPERTRTLGIITKPDTLQHRGSESMRIIRKLATNQDENYKFFLGWHVLKNRGPENQDQTTAERDASEIAFFKQQPWVSFEDQKCLGVDALRIRLSRVLHQRIASSLPDIVKEINVEITKSESEVLKMGKSRSTRQDKEVYLINIASRFQTLAQSASDGTWSDRFDEFFKNPYTSEGYDRRLRAVVQNLNDQFAELMAQKGHQWKLISEQSDSENDSDSGDDLDSDNNSVSMSSSGGHYLESSSFKDPERLTREAFLKKIERLSRSTRSRELRGVFNHHTIGELFREQSIKWKEIAEYHVETVWSAVKVFLEEAFQTMANGKNLSAILFDFIYPKMEQRREKAKAKLIEILLPHTRLHPISYNSKLVKTMKEVKYERERRNLQEKLWPPGSEEGNTTKSTSRNFKLELLEALRPSSEELEDKFGCSDILDYMQAYYEVRNLEMRSAKVFKAFSRNY
jgi:GTPase SAR1 family protein